MAVPQIDDLRVFQRERQKHVRPCNNVHRRYVATHSNADAARQAGAAEHQVVLGRLARRTTDSDVLSSLVVPQRNPLPGDERVASGPRQSGGLAPPSSAKRWVVESLCSHDDVHRAVGQQRRNFPRVEMHGGQIQVGRDLHHPLDEGWQSEKL